ncbi:hypothetical protein NDW01_36760 [Actinoallomurus sp. WRP6H-15]|nr:hypothetical protein [Actinoallomurus soli]
MSTGRSASDPDLARVVQERIDAFRRNLRGGRGPGVSEEEWLRNSTLRGTVGGVPTAVLREDLRLRTLRIRGERPERLEAEAEWATAQFRAGRGEFRTSGSPGRGRRPSPARIVLTLGLLGVALRRLLRARGVRRRRASPRSRSPAS